ncbi:hypothetical protein CPB84DRAFT_1758047 [Gymnopilus junonius]|uniref:Uncharacterized protein n=1 Tax=Gymnopilus junonius TaxID=109634 RepID=A0A9P5P423_GYMJU|nr:hypothetical protein CPB84DRAFT_1758047 [Gymnopilus junonius]
MSVHDISEHPHPPRSRDWSFYAVFFLAVVPLWSSVPLAWLFAAYSLYGSRWLSYGTVGRSILFISCCELLFSLYHLHLARRISGPSPCGPGDPHEIQLAFLRMLKSGLSNFPEDGGDVETPFINRPSSPAEIITQLELHDPRAIDFRHCMRTWFRNVPWSSVKLLEMQKWLYWAMYNADLPPLDQLPEAHRQALDDSVGLIQKRLGCKIEEGSNPKVIPIRLTIDRTNVLWRPLIFYALMGSMNWVLGSFYKRYWNIHYGHSNGLEYILRMPAKWNPDTSPRPIVFIHGLGLGLLQYHSFISHLLKKFPDRPILILLQPQISQNFFHPHFLKPPSRHEMADRLAGLLQELGWVSLRETKRATVEYEEEKEVASSLLGDPRRGVTLLSHSNGTYVHAWVLKCYPNIVARSCFIDPVTFCSWEGDVCYNFFYRTCTTGMELIIRYFVGTELGVVNLVQRHFCWTSNSLWFEEIPNATDFQKTLFLLGGKDSIVHSERVKRYLVSHGVRENLWYDPEGTHGDALVKSGLGLEKILLWLSEDH